MTVLALLGSAIVLALLTRLTRWGRQFRRLSYPYFSPRGGQGLGPLLTLIAVIALAIADVRLSVILSYLVNDLYTALQNGDAASLRPLRRHLRDPLGVLPGPGAARVLRPAAADPALAGVAQRPRRRRLARRPGLLPRRASPRTRSTTPTSASSRTSPASSRDALSLGIGAISSMVSLVSFTVILWQLSGPLTVFGVEIPRAMTFAAYLYVHRGHRDRVPHRPPADPAELPQRGPHRLLPLRARPAARQLRERRHVPRRGRGARHPVRALPRGDRQRVGDRLPHAEVLRASTS